MKLFQLNDLTKLPEPSPELLTIVEFKELIRRVKKIDGDADGRKKTMNLMELSYIYYMCVYDSRFKLVKGKDKEEKVKKLVGLPTEWVADDIVLKAMEAYNETQVTESTELVEVLSESIQNLTKFLRTAQGQVGSVGMMASKDVNEFLDVLDRVPKTVENLRQAKAQLDREHDALAKGRKGRQLNKFELESK